MAKNIRQVVDDLESLQYSILFWKRKEQNKENIKRLSDYDEHLDSIIEDLLQIDGMER